MSVLEDSIAEIVRRVIHEEMPAQRSPRPLLSADQVGKRLSIDKQSVYRLRREGQLRAIKLSESRYMFQEEEIERFLADGGIKTSLKEVSKSKVAARR